ncbi:MAG: prenyltransferase [Sulfuricellaceae bacterium]|nr:prenyltransferase [Sulfuricellaceae bacterium]
MSTVEPTLAALPKPLPRYFLATRPAFLSVTFVACLIGLAAAFADGLPLRASTALASVVFALVAHAGVNVLNDYYDALNGTDALNIERLFPFTGGSRFIQNGVLSLRETAIFGLVLFALVMAAGLWLMRVSGLGLFWIGALGLLVGWAYSAPPLKLNSRGLGEFGVLLGFLLIVAGTDYVQRGGFSEYPLAAGLPFALLVTGLLYINQFPDRRADEAAGKHTVVVRWGAQRAVYGYWLLAALAYGWLAAAVGLGLLPLVALIALAPAKFSLSAAQDLRRYAAEPKRLAPAIQATILAAIAHGILLAAALALHQGKIL